MSRRIPIVYTCRQCVSNRGPEEVVPLETLYEWCRIARNLLQETMG